MHADKWHSAQETPSARNPSLAPQAHSLHPTLQHLDHVDLAGDRDRCQRPTSPHAGTGDVHILYIKLLSSGLVLGVLQAWEAVARPQHPSGM
jgi:hypothetical protein